MAFSRSEHSADKYIQSIKDDHLKMISDPVVILRHLIGLYLENAPPHFSFFSYQDITTSEIRRLYNQLKDSSTVDISAAILDIKVDRYSPVSSELEAMWVAFYKYYFRLLPVPESDSYFYPVLVKAKNLSFVDRYNSFNNEVETAFNFAGTDIDRELEKEIEYLLRSASYHEVNEVLLKNETLQKGLDLLIQCNPRYFYYLINILIESTHTHEKKIFSIKYLLEKLKVQILPEDLDGVIFYLYPILEELNKDRITLDIAIQQDLIDMVLARLRYYDEDLIDFANYLANLEIIDEKIKKNLHECLSSIITTAASTDLYAFFKSIGIYRDLFETLAENDKTFEAIFEILKKSRKSGYCEIEHLRKLYETVDQKNHNPFLEYCLGVFEDNLYYADFNQEKELDFLLHASIPDYLKPRVNAYLAKIEKISIPFVLVLFNNRIEATTIKDEDELWGYVGFILNHLSGFTAGYHLMGQTEQYCFLTNIINQGVIPDRHYYFVISALKECVFRTLTPSNSYYSLVVKRYVSCLSEDERQSLYLKAKELLFDNEDNRKIAIFVLLDLSEYNVPLLDLKNTLLKALREKDVHFMRDHWILLTKLNTLFPEYNNLLIYPFNNSESVMSALQEKTLTEKEKNDQLCKFIFDDVSKEVTMVKLWHIQRIKLSQKWSQQFIHLLISYQSNNNPLPPEMFYDRLMKTLLVLIRSSGLRVDMTLTQAVSFLESFDKYSISYSDYYLFSDLISYLPIDVQIGLMTHAEKLPMRFGYSALVKEAIQVRLELEDSKREVPSEVWREIYKWT